MTTLVVVSIVLVPLAVWGMVSPRSQWHALSAWRYRDAEANEPSDAVHLLTRVGCAVLVVVLAFLLVAVGTADDGPADDAARDGSPDVARDTGTTNDYLVTGTPIGAVDLAVSPPRYTARGPRALGLRLRTTQLWYCPVDVAVERQTPRVVELALTYRNLRPDSRSCTPYAELPRAATPTVVRLDEPLGDRRVVLTGPPRRALEPVAPR